MAHAMSQPLTLARPYARAAFSLARDEGRQLALVENVVGLVLRHVRLQQTEAVAVDRPHKQAGEAVKVVILGQDPYHGQGQAVGLSFAVEEGVRLPPSLQNMFKELASDLGEPLKHADGDLTRWAKQGVLLLNATLTVRAGLAGSHQGKGWELFTDAAIKALSDKREHLVFILWGNYARQKGTHIDRSKHCVIESPHPSPFSAANGFFGSKPFTQSNDLLRKAGRGEIDWARTS